MEKNKKSSLAINKILITKVIKLSEDKFSIIIKQNYENSQKEKENIIFQNKNVINELNKFNLLFSSNHIHKSNIQFNITSIIKTNNSNNNQYQKFQINIYSINSFTLLYFIKNIFFDIKDIALINKEKELIVMEAEKIYILNLINNNFIITYIINNPILIFIILNNFLKLYMMITIFFLQMKF